MSLLPARRGWFDTSRSSLVTALDFFVQPDHVIFATDTLSVDADAQQPHSFLTKFAVLPHLGLAATGTGNGLFLAEWYSVLRSDLIARDIDHVDSYAPGELRRIGDSHDLTSSTATAYHFGYSPSRDRYVAHVYRSTRQFESELILDGMGLKPPISDPPDAPEFPQAFVEIMTRQHDEDRARPTHQRVGIGGEIQCVHVSGGGFLVFTLHRFPSYEEDYTMMCSRL